MYKFPYGIQSNYGFFHVYAFTMTAGILIAALLTYVKMQRRSIPAQPLLGCLIIVVPCALFGASFFGKLDANGTGVRSDWWTLFYFWQGGLSIHGAILFGIVAGTAFFAIFSRRYQVSMWVYLDAILPNILIGQVIGRWGNFFNHELLGDVVSYSSLNWLPNFIQDNCFKLVNGLPEMHNGLIVYREPIFLYESFGNFMAWMLITFAVPHIGKWFGPKPYKKNRTVWKYSFWYNLKYWGRIKPDPDYLSYHEVWKRSFNDFQPTLTASRHLRGGALVRAHNPRRYFITKAGVEGGMYFFLWNGIRLILETHRQDPAELFLPYHRTLDYALIGSFAAIGLIIVLLTQYVIPLFLRQPGWKYEKDYYDFSYLNQWQYKNYAYRHMLIGHDNTQQNIQEYLTRHITSTIGVDFTQDNLNKFFIITQLNLNHHANEHGSLLIRYKITPTALATTKFGIINEPYLVVLDFTMNLKRLFKYSLRHKYIKAHSFSDEIKLQKFFNNYLRSNAVQQYYWDLLRQKFDHVQHEAMLIKNLINNQQCNYQALAWVQRPKKIVINPELTADNAWFYVNKPFQTVLQ